MYACSGCDNLYDDLQGLNSHLESNCDGGEGGPAYCCGMMYDDGESTCGSCGEPL